MKTKKFAPENQRAGKGVKFLLVFYMVMSGIMAQPDLCLSADLKLIDAQLLNHNRADWILLDARPLSAWEKGHIPGAISFSWETYTKTDKGNIPYRIQEPDIMDRILGNLGIRVDSPVAVYGDADTSWGGEGWVCWSLVWLGHQGQIALLDGGIQAWEGKGFSLVSGTDSPAMTSVVYQSSPVSSMIVSAQDIHHGAGTLQLVDTRSTLEWFRGRIPGAVHIPWENFFTGKNRQALDRKSILALLTKHRITLDKPVVYYCTGGIRSAYAWMIHELAGLPGAVNYEGGFEEWKVIYP